MFKKLGLLAAVAVIVAVVISPVKAYIFQSPVPEPQPTLYSFRANEIPEGTTGYYELTFTKQGRAEIKDVWIDDEPIRVLFNEVDISDQFPMSIPDGETVPHLEKPVTLTVEENAKLRFEFEDTVGGNAEFSIVMRYPHLAIHDFRVTGVNANTNGRFLIIFPENAQLLVERAWVDDAIESTTVNGQLSNLFDFGTVQGETLLQLLQEVRVLTHPGDKLVFNIADTNGGYFGMGVIMQHPIYQTYLPTILKK